MKFSKSWYRALQWHNWKHLSYYCSSNISCIYLRLKRLRSYLPEEHAAVTVQNNAPRSPVPASDFASNAHHDNFSSFIHANSILRLTKSILTAEITNRLANNIRDTESIFSSSAVASAVSLPQTSPGWASWDMGSLPWKVSHSMSKCMALPHIGWPSNSIKSENGSIIIILLHRYQSLIGVTPWDYDHLKSDAVHQVT